VSLALLTAVLEWVEQLRIQARQASEVLGVYLVCFALVAGIDEPPLARIGYQDLMATFLLEHPAHPGRMGSCFYSYAQRLLLRSEASPEGLWGGAQPTLLDHLTALCVDEAEVAILVAQIQSGCNLWLYFATIHLGSILLSGR
jgi:hypothetical protein